MSPPLYKQPFSSEPDLTTEKSVSGLADIVTRSWTEPNADDSYASPKKNLSRRLAQNIEANAGIETAAGLYTIGEDASAFPETFDFKALSPRARRSATLAAKAVIAAQRLEEQGTQNAHSRVDGDLGSVAVGQLYFDGSREETAIFKDLFKVLESNRGPIGHWLWQMGEHYLTDKIPVIKNAADLKVCLERQYECQGRACFPVFHNKKIAGLISCGLPDRGNPGEIQYWLGKDVQGKRVIQRALGELEKILPPEIKEIHADIESHHFKSRSVFRGIGATLESSDVSLDPVPPRWAQALPRQHTMEYNRLYRKKLPLDARSAGPVRSAAELYRAYRPGLYRRFKEVVVGRVARPQFAINSCWNLTFGSLFSACAGQRGDLLEIHTEPRSDIAKSAKGHSEGLGR